VRDVVRQVETEIERRYRLRREGLEEQRTQLEEQLNSLPDQESETARLILEALALLPVPRGSQRPSWDKPTPIVPDSGARGWMR
jgi:hypothetical protein